MARKKLIFLLLIKFFRKYDGLLEKYCTNARNYHGLCVTGMTPREKTDYILNRMLSKIDVENERHVKDFFIAFDTSFDWSFTFEGADFWSMISNNWTKFIWEFENDNYVL